MEQNKRPGDATRITREYIDSLLVEMRHIGADIASTELHLYGKTFATPVMTAALSHLDGTHPGGMAEMARGAARANAVMWCGMGGKAELEAMVETGASVIKIIKPYADNEVVLDRIRHAEACGALAVGMDIDHAFNPGGGYDRIDGLDMRPKGVEEIARFAKATSIPFIIKGVLSVQDARKCMEAGAGGMVVSHHSGRLDYAVPPLMILPEIMAVVGDKMPVFVDCGLETGMDVLKALALGATACSIGRPLMRELADGGAQGVADAIGAITQALAYAMEMTNSPDIRRIDPGVLRRR